jgi:hypothetical protein
MKSFNRTRDLASSGLLIPGLIMVILIWATADHVRAAGNYAVWSGCVSGTNGNITNIVSGSGAYVCICSNKMIVSSSNGTSWSTAYTATDIPTDMVYSGGKFFGCAGSSFLTSTDGAVWTSATFHGPNPNYPYTINAISYGVSGEMVAGGYSAILCSSDYGATWIPLYLGAMQSYFGKMTYLTSTDQFVGLGTGGQIVRISKSVDDSGRIRFTYEPIASTETMYFSALNYNPYSQTWYGISVELSHYYMISASKNLYSWNNVDSGQGDITGITFYNGMAFGTGSIRGNMPAVDTSGAWSHQNLNSNNVAINDIAYGDSAYIAVGNNGVIFSSINGTSWIACGSGTTQNLNKVIFSGGAFTAVGDNGTIITTNRATSINNNRRIEHTLANRSHDLRNIPLHAYSINGRELKSISRSLACDGPATAILQKRSGNGAPGLVVWR